ncbi:Sialidase-3 [Merluccius polli]|uniref:Sialidase-3 n=1 Tax=Merluccius polli TaxID=89951 RepID=A0AA47P8Y5_MERPO|nr:Sialidase-3 [Merluccius polli]
MSKSTWDPPVVIHRGPSGYSDLAYNQDDHSFSCLLECGQHSELEQIAFTSFKLADVRPASD